MKRIKNKINETGEKKYNSVSILNGGLAGKNKSISKNKYKNLKLLIKVKI